MAKYGGIAAAVRNIPYGIQQPAVSGQIARLEEALGAKLFNRRPFSLLPAGVWIKNGERLARILAGRTVADGWFHRLAGSAMR